MIISTRLLGWGLAAAMALSLASPARAAAQMPTALSMLVGQWTCTYTGPKGTAKSTYTIKKVGDLWVEGGGENGAYGGHPANTAMFEFGYDPKKQLYITMGGDTLPGDYGISTAPGSSTATTMTFVNNYPEDPTHERDLWHYTKTAIMVNSTWVEKGKAMTSKTVCMPG